MTMTPLDPKPILDVGFGFWPSKVLLSAVELGVFTELAKAPRTRDELGAALKIHPRGSIDLFDTLVALGFLERDGRGERAVYRTRAPRWRTNRIVASRHQSFYALMYADDAHAR